ncbi:MAG: DUF1289 domain-containing protein [Proteobacteria bacterium]|nr:DUF1289 domain-containing protein [Pseudomonadota bacterium]
MTAIASPCVGICRFGGSSDYCLGCGRTAEELSNWRTMAESQRQRVWDGLLARFAELGIVVSRLPWLEIDILEYVERTLRSGEGTWVFGVYGAVAEFIRDRDEVVVVTRKDATIEAVTPRAALRLTGDQGVRALRVDTGASGLSGTERIVLAVPRAKRALRAVDSLTLRGPDTAAIRRADRQCPLYDLGLGSANIRFCVRAQSERCAAELRSREGMQLPAFLPELGPTLSDENATRVVETRLGRIEIRTPISPPNASLTYGPNTHFLPERFQLNRDMPPGLDLPEAYVPGAIYYA